MAQGEADLRFLCKQSKVGKCYDCQTSNTSKNENLPTFAPNFTGFYSLEITEANRNYYTAVIVEWQDIEVGKTKKHQDMLK